MINLATSLFAPMAIAAYGRYRLTKRVAPSGEDRGTFQAAPFAGTSTPQTLVLSPATEDLPENPPDAPPSDQAPDDDRAPSR